MKKLHETKNITLVFIIVGISQFRSNAQQIIDTTKYDCAVVMNSMKRDTLEEIIFFAENA